MEIAIRTLGNSKGVVLPKPLLMQAGLDAESKAEGVVEDGAIVLRRPARPPSRRMGGRGPLAGQSAGRCAADG